MKDLPESVATEIRKAFEAWVIHPPLERGISRYAENGAWPGAYTDYKVHLAWDTWQEAYRLAWDAALEEAAKVCDRLARDATVRAKIGDDPEIQVEYVFNSEWLAKAIHSLKLGAKP